MFAGTVVAGTYFAWKYATSKLSEYQDQQMAVAFASARRQTHFEANQRTANATLNSLMPGLRGSLLNELNCERLTDQLKLRPTNKVAIWSELKILAFTRTLVSVYSTCILTLTLKVQLNIIAGYIYSRNETKGDQPLTQEETAAQQKYIESIQWFLGTGSHKLCDLVHHSVEKELMNVSLKQAFTFSAFQELVGKVRSSIESTVDSSISSPFVSFITPLTSEKMDMTDCQSTFSLDRLLAETNDILNSNDYRIILQLMIDNGFDLLYKQVTKVFTPLVVDPQTAHSFGDSDGVTVGIPIARIIPPLVGSIHSICGDTTSDYVRQIVTMRCINDFANQIYEAFCQPV